MKKSVLLGTGVLATALMTGCGGSSSGGGTSVSEYDLSAYEGRSVATDTLAGTWVAVGTGLSEYTSSHGATTTNFAIKEYFVITDTGTNLRKASCESSINQTVSISGNTITVGDFVGTLTDNKSMTGKIEKSYGVGDTTETNLTIVKISDVVTPVAAVTASVNGQSTGVDLYCYQQANAAATNGSLSAKSQEITTSVLELERWVGDDGYTALYSSSFSADWDTEYGDSVSFEVNTDSSLSETVNFNGSDGSNSVTGSIVVQLPVQ